MSKIGKAVQQAKKKILRDDYKPKLKNEKESYAAATRTGDYSDFIKNSERIKARKRRNRAGVVVGGAAAAAAIQSRKDKQNKK
tara:strand:- start:198 stop:446 length:249 start_codon:yes stop_codon:yes gene_type:complete